MVSISREGKGCKIVRTSSTIQIAIAIQIARQFCSCSRTGLLSTTRQAMHTRVAGRCTCILILTANIIGAGATA
eukprot:Skav211565  [mRNA]  locus=scaffold2228:179077:179298:- [translate_table: standard]